jgi:hypothetical protein
VTASAVDFMAKSDKVVLPGIYARDLLNKISGIFAANPLFPLRTYLTQKKGIYQKEHGDFKRISPCSLPAPCSRHACVLGGENW